MQHVWQAPRPGRFLALAWVVGQPGSILYLNWEDELRSALDRFVFVIDPKAELSEVEQIRARFGTIGRTARVRYRWSRLANVLVVASLGVYVAVAVVSGERAVGGFAIEWPTVLVYPALAFVFGIFADRRARRSAREIQELDAPAVLRSRRIGADSAARRLIADAEQWSAGEQRELLGILWRIARAERGRSDYLESVEVFDEEEFAPLLQQIADAEADLRSWSGSRVTPAVVRRNPRRA